MEWKSTVLETIQYMRMEKVIYKDYVPQEAITRGENLKNVTKDLSEDILLEIVRMLKLEIPKEYPYPAVYWYSVLLNLKKEPDMMDELIEYILKNKDVFSANTLYFLYYQLKTLKFTFSLLFDRQSTTELLWKLYLEIVDLFLNETSTSLDYIPYDKRNHDLVIVIAEQIIGVEHGPTKTAFDRCKIIMDKMKKSVLLINTTEVLSNVGSIPFSNTVIANVMLQKELEEFQEWKGTQIPFYQCPYNMPNLESINNLLSDIKELAPGRVVAIGGSSILSNLVNKMIPVVTIGLCPSELAYTSTTYQTLSCKLTNDDLKLLCNLGFHKDHVIESIFTSSLKVQQEKITKETLGIDKKQFLIIVVGGRLKEEVTDEFLEAMQDIIRDDIHLGFLGRFQDYDIRMEKYPRLNKHASYFGFCSDILSRMEICDLYVNPTRRGGGTSCVEAMYMGVPVVTTKYGDVATNVGDEFCVEDYSEMKQKIMQYYTDRAYYMEMSQKAKKRTEVLLDTEGEFVRIMREVDRRECMLEQ